MASNTRKARTPYSYAGGSPFAYIDEVDTNNIWSPWLRIRADEIERFTNKILNDPGSSRFIKCDAERVLRHAEELRSELSKGSIEDAANAALSLGIAADALAFQWEFGRDLITGQRKRRGGFKGAERAGHDRDVHAQWLVLDEELRAASLKSQRARAREIGRRTNANAETVRKFLARRM